MAQHLEQVQTGKFDGEQMLSRLDGAGLEEDANDSEVASDDDVPKLQHLPDQVWEYPLTRKDQHRRFAKMQDLACEDAEARCAQLKIEKLKTDRELKSTKSKLITKEGALNDTMPRLEKLRQEDARKQMALDLFMEMMDQALRTHPDVDEETRSAWAAIRLMGCPGTSKAGNLGTKNRASSSTASTRASTCTRASTSDDADPEPDDVEEEPEDEIDQFAEFMKRSRALLDNLDRQPQAAAADAAARAPAAAAGPAAAAPAAAPQQQQPAPRAIADVPTIWSRTKGVLVDLFQPFETELPEVDETE